MERPKRQPGESLTDYMVRRDEWIMANRARRYGPMTPHVGERVIERIKEVPVERIVRETVTEYVDDPETLKRLAEVEALLEDAKAKLEVSPITDHGLFETEDVIDVELPEALKAHMKEGETIEAAKVRLKKEWFDLCQRFIAASRGETVLDPLTPDEHKKMNDLNIFAWG